MLPLGVAKSFGASAEKLSGLYAEALACEGELRRVQQRQILLAGTDPLALPAWREAKALQDARLAAQLSSVPAAAGGGDVRRENLNSAAQPPPETAAAADTAGTSQLVATVALPLSAEGEAALAAFAALQDTLKRNDALALAREVGCGVTAVEDFFARHRAAAQAALLRAQRRAGGDAAEPQQSSDPADGGAGDRAGDRGAAKWAADAAALDKERDKKLADLDLLLDGAGRIARPDFAGPFAALMQRMHAPSVRAAALCALAASAGHPATASRLLAAPRFQQALETWAVQLEADRQTSALHTLLAALRTLTLIPLPPPGKWAKSLVRAIERLAKYREARVAAAAAALAERLSRGDYRAGPPGPLPLKRSRQSELRAGGAGLELQPLKRSRRACEEPADRARTAGSAHDPWEAALAEEQRRVVAANLQSADQRLMQRARRLQQEAAWARVPEDPRLRARLAIRASFPPLPMHVPLPAPPLLPAAAGEESSEVAAQRALRAVGGPLPSAGSLGWMDPGEPNDPPLGDRRPPPGALPHALPCNPVDAGEAATQLEGLIAAGVRLPELIGWRMARQ
ncbi:hypothetical protein WJX81_005975 [Elliptochloris bilobata]|uniref:Uncharacterized protein n=1 Tax=Elliptochloris bilobata TaxID=381761 RepID=A0AAW1SE85_9CHLO